MLGNISNDNTRTNNNSTHCLHPIRLSSPLPLTRGEKRPRRKNNREGMRNITSLLYVLLRPLQLYTRISATTTRATRTRLPRHCETRWTIIENCILGQATDYRFFPYPSSLDLPLHQIVVTVSSGAAGATLWPLAWHWKNFKLRKFRSDENCRSSTKAPTFFILSVSTLKNYATLCRGPYSQARHTECTRITIYLCQIYFAVPLLVLLVVVINFYCYSSSTKVETNWKEFSQLWQGRHTGWDAPLFMLCIDHQYMNLIVWPKNKEAILFRQEFIVGLMSPSQAVVEYIVTISISRLNQEIVGVSALLENPDIKFTTHKTPQNIELFFSLNKIVIYLVNFMNDNFFS